MSPPPIPAQPPSTRTTPAAYIAASVSTPVPPIVSGTRSRFAARPHPSMIHVEFGQQPITDSFVDHIDKCLDCRASKPRALRGRIWKTRRACPRAHRARLSPLWLARVTRDFVFPALAPRSAPHNRRRTRSAFLSTVRPAGHRAWYRRPETSRLAERERLLRASTTIFSFVASAGRFPPPVRAAPAVAFFAGCVANVTFSQLNEATIRVLTANAAKSSSPLASSAAARSRRHAGVRDAARELARKISPYFFAKISTPSSPTPAGCGSTLKEYHQLFLTKRARAAGTRVCRQDSRRHRVPCRSRPHRRIEAAFQSASLTRIPAIFFTAKKSRSSRALLHAIPNLDLVELPYSEICCGSAGVYNVTQTETSLELLADKMRHAQSTRAQTSSPPTPAASCNFAPAPPSTAPTRRSSTSSNSSIEACGP